MQIDIRPIREDDAQDYLELGKQLDRETKFMLYEPEERHIALEEQRERIRRSLASDNKILLVAEASGRLVGFISANGGDQKRKRHQAHITVGILQAYTGQGLGTRLFTELEKWAHENRLHRLELTVMSHNQRGIALYKKMGFIEEGTKVHSLFIDGEYIDELYMVKLI